jgi:hypothetical protein
MRTTLTLSILLVLVCAGCTSSVPAPLAPSASQSRTSIARSDDCWWCPPPVLGCLVPEVKTLVYSPTAVYADLGPDPKRIRNLTWKVYVNDEVPATPMRGEGSPAYVTFFTKGLKGVIFGTPSTNSALCYVDVIDPLEPPLDPPFMVKGPEVFLH